MPSARRIRTEPFAGSVRIHIGDRINNDQNGHSAEFIQQLSLQTDRHQIDCKLNSLSRIILKGYKNGPIDKNKSQTPVYEWPTRVIIIVGRQSNILPFRFVRQTNANRYWKISVIID